MGQYLRTRSRMSLFIACQGAPEAFFDADLRGPSQGPDLSNIRGQIAHPDDLVELRRLQRADLRAPAREPVQAFDQVFEEDRLTGTREVEFPGRRALRDCHQRLDRVIDRQVVAEEVSASIEVNRLAQLGLANEIVEGAFFCIA